MARQHNSSETRELIISSAIDCILEKGYSATTLEDIVKRVGLTRGAFYWNFESKAEILDEIINRYESYYRKIYESICYEKSAEDTLRRFLYADLKPKTTFNPYVSIVRYKLEASQAAIDLQQRQKHLDEQAISDIKKVIEIGIKNGEFKNKEDPEFIALSIYLLLAGFQTIASANNNDGPMSEIGDQEIKKLIDLILDNLKK